MLGKTFFNISWANMLRSSTFFLKDSKDFATVTPTTTKPLRHKRKRSQFAVRSKSNKEEKWPAEDPPWVTGNIEKNRYFHFKVQTFRLQLLFPMAHCGVRTFLGAEMENCRKKGWAPHQILRAVQFMSGRSAACDEGFKHGADDNAFHVLGCGFVVHCGEVISKTSLVWNSKLWIKGSFHQATQFNEVLGSPG